MLKTVGAIVLVAIVIIVGLAARQPDTFRLERAAQIEAPPERVYALLSDFHQWQAWSPWEKLDPAMKRDISEPANGKGAFYAWDGNNKAGAGRMEIVGAAPPSQLAIQLDFFRPMETRNAVEFTVQPQGDGTHVRWSMSGPNNFLSKVMQVFVDMDEMIGKDFEAGLANLKTLAEQRTQQAGEAIRP